MKQYKLIKEYPNAPAKVGTIFTYWTDGISVQYYNPTASSKYIPEKTILDYPEFWQEVEENDWEILKFRGLNDINYHGLNIVKLNTRTNCYDWDIEHCEGASLDGLKLFINNKNWEIYQVKRLTDGEVFTIGDKVVSPISGINKPQKIKLIRIIDNSIFVKGDSFQITLNKIEHFTEFPLSYNNLKNGEIYTTYYPGQGLYVFKQGYNLWINLEDNVIQNVNGDFIPENGFTCFRKATREEINKLKSPILITEDGIPIYDGEKFYPLCVENGSSDGYKPFEKINQRWTILPKKGFKAFSTIEAVEKYILENKPCLSIKDVQSVYVSAREGYRKNGNGIQYYYELVKLVNKNKNK